MANHRRNIVHTAVPESIGDYYHNTIKSNWSLHVPAQRDAINHCENPSFEIGGTGTGGWVNPAGDFLLTSPAAFATRTTSEAYSGAYSLNVGAGEIRMIPLTLSLSSATITGQTVTAKAYVKTTAGATVTIYLDDYTVVSTASNYVATGGWQEVSVSITGGTNILYLIVKSTANFYLDAVSYLVGSVLPGIYFDGDVDYDDYASWDGPPHASTSRLSRFYWMLRDVLNFTDIGFDIFAHTGAGIAEPHVSSTPYALMDGSFYQRTVFSDKTITLIGTFSGDTPSEVNLSRQKMINAIYPYFNTREHRELHLLYSLVDDCGKSLSPTMYIPVVYSGGMDGNMTNLYVDRASIQFVASYPHWTKIISNTATGYFYVDIEYNGTAPAPLELVVSPSVVGGSATITKIQNVATGQSIEFTRLNAGGISIPAYSYIYMNTDPRSLKVIGYPSGTNGLAHMTASTVPDNFKLVPGSNRLVISGTGGPKIDVTWKDRHYSIDAAAVMK